MSKTIPTPTHELHRLERARAIRFVPLAAGVMATDGDGNILTSADSYKAARASLVQQLAAGRVAR